MTGGLRPSTVLPLLREAAIMIPPTLRALLALVFLLENKASLRNIELVILVSEAVLFENMSLVKIDGGMLSEAVSAAEEVPSWLTERDMASIGLSLLKLKSPPKSAENTWPLNVSGFTS